MHDIDSLERERRTLLALAYRMLGTVSDAEDAVQETYLRWYRLTDAERDAIENPAAWLTRVASRVCLDVLGSARVRRESYVGEWLPEPLVEDGRTNPSESAELADSLSLAFLVLLESLTPEQRAAFLLREVFDYPYDEIAGIVGTSEDNARQLVTRARRFVDERRPRFEASPQLRDQLAQTFFAAVTRGDLDALEELLADDVVMHGDGGGRVRAITRPLQGRTKVARLLVSGMRRALASGGFIPHPALINGQPGARFYDAAGALVAVVVLDVVDGKVQALHAVLNPDKLSHLQVEP